MPVTLPSLPSSQTESGVNLALVRTVSDALAHLRDWAGVTNDQNTVRMAYRAVRESLEELATIRVWSYYKRRLRFATVASYSTGTITYTHSTLTLTLASGTWPSWSARGTVVIADVHYPVQSRSSDSVLILDPNHNPGANVAAGTSYQIYRDSYTLPRDFQSVLTEIRDLDDVNRLTYVTSQDFQNYSDYQPDPGDPKVFTVMRERAYLGQDAVDATMHDMAIYLRPPPNTARTYDGIYKCRPRDFSVPNGSYSTGTVTNSSTAVTGSGTTWTQANMLGAIFRFGTQSAAPGGREHTNKYVVQRYVTAVNSATSLDLDSDPGQTFTSVKYEISDPLDVEPGAMYRALLRRAEYELAIQRHKDDPKAIEVAEARWLRACREAMAADNRAALAATTNGYYDTLGQITMSA